MANQEVDHINAVDGEDHHEKPPQEKPPQEKRGRSKRRETSSDALSALNEKFSKMRDMMMELVDGLDEVKERITKVDRTIRDDFSLVMNGAIGPLQMKDEALEASIEGLKLDVQEKENSHQAEIEALKVEIQELKTKLVLCKTSIANGATANNALTVHTAPRIEVPKPKEFTGERSAMEVDNFLWSMERYFDAAGIHDDVTKVLNATLFFADNAILWW